jgi:hypothetical protein
VFPLDEAELSKVMTQAWAKSPFMGKQKITIRKAGRTKRLKFLDKFPIEEASIFQTATPGKYFRNLFPEPVKNPPRQRLVFITEDHKFLIQLLLKPNTKTRAVSRW